MRAPAKTLPRVHGEVAAIFDVLVVRYSLIRKRSTGASLQNPRDHKAARSHEQENRKSTQNQDATHDKPQKDHVPASTLAALTGAGGKNYEGDCMPQLSDPQDEIQDAAARDQESGPPASLKRIHNGKNCDLQIGRKPGSEKQEPVRCLLIADSSER